MEFLKGYTPSEQGGYREGMSISEKYNCWAAAQYRDKASTRFCEKVNIFKLTHR